MERGEAGKIAYLTGEYPAVSHTFILREVEALRRRGREVITCSIRRTGPEHHRGSAERDAARSTFYVIDAAKNPARLFSAIGKALAAPARLGAATALAWRTRPPGFRALLWQIFYLIEAMVLAHHLRREAVTHLHNHFGNSSCSVAMLASELSGIPFSYTMHGPAIFFEPRLWRIDEKIARARFVACISHFCRSQGMIFADPMHWPKMHIVHCGISPMAYGRDPKMPQGKTIVFVGRLAAVKGVPILLEAFSQIYAQHTDAQLVLIGDGPERPRLEKHAGELGFADAVRFTGYLSQTEVAKALRTADIFVLPSFAEGVPVVLMEAMASELPVIAPRVAGIPELVEHRVNGLTISPGDADSLAVALDQLLSDPELRRIMGKAGRAHVEADYNIETEAAWLDQILSGEIVSGALRPTRTT